MQTSNLEKIAGATVIDLEGNKLGTVNEVFLDATEGTPEWAAVDTGVMGFGGTSFVPLRNADLTGDGLRVPFAKDKVKDAPDIATDHALTIEEETTLFNYYGVDGFSGSGGSGGSGGGSGEGGRDDSRLRRYDGNTWSQDQGSQSSGSDEGNAWT